MNLFAHGTEQHSEQTSQFEHIVTEPAFAIPLFILILIGIYYGLTSIGWPVSRIIIVELIIIFFTGVLTYSLIPALSITCITVGIISALFLTLTQLAGD